MYNKDVMSVMGFYVDECNIIRKKDSDELAKSISGAAVNIKDLYGFSKYGLLTKDDLASLTRDDD